MAKSITDRIDILGHWIWALPILLLAAALTVPQVDLYPPAPDEFFSLYMAGLAVDGPFSPAEIVETIQKFNPDHTPSYFMLLSLWGNLTAPEIGMARVLSILIHLLFLAIMFHLARRFLAPIAGLFALVVICSSAFYNFYIAHARMYTLLLLLASIVLWLYLRIMRKRGRVGRSEYALLGAAVFALITTHAYSTLFLLMLGIYHLAVARKNRRWVLVSATVVAATLLFLPYLLQMTSLLGAIADMRAQSQGIEVILAWFKLALNGQPFLLLLTIAGLLYGAWKRTIMFKPWLAMIAIYLVILGLMEMVTGFVEISGMRYHLTGWLLFVLVIVAALVTLYRIRRWLGMMALFAWVLAGAWFQTSTNWWIYLTVLGDVVVSPPTQVISRLAAGADPTPAILGYALSTIHKYYLTWNGYFLFSSIIDYTQEDHYFTSLGIQHHAANEMDDFDDRAHRFAVTSPALWVYHQPSRATAAETARAESIIAELNYEHCATTRVGRNTFIAQYAWRTIGCRPPQPLSSHRTESIDYRFYGAGLEAAGDRLYFSDSWTALGSFSAERYSMSYQLLTADWDKVAQLDLPLAHPDQLRMYYIDVAKAPAGSYRLMAIVYDAQSGERFAWLDNSGDVDELLLLGEFALE